jgi:uridine nucleosidase
MEESNLRAPESIITAILDHPHEITLFLIGPLTNAAMAVILEPAIIPLVKEVVIMGGAVRRPGNITPTAEANFYHDPHAAQIVMSAGWPISLAPLDVCDHGLIPLTLLDEICQADKALTPFIAGGSPFYRAFSKNYYGIDQIDFPDSLTAGYLLKPEIYTLEDVPIFVETEGSCMGQSVEVPRGKWYQDFADRRFFTPDRTISSVKVMFRVDTQGFVDLVEELLV